MQESSNHIGYVVAGRFDLVSNCVKFGMVHIFKRQNTTKGKGHEGEEEEERKDGGKLGLEDKRGERGNIAQG